MPSQHVTPVGDPRIPLWHYFVEFDHRTSGKPCSCHYVVVRWWNSSDDSKTSFHCITSGGHRLYHYFKIKLWNPRIYHLMNGIPSYLGFRERSGHVSSSRVSYDCCRKGFPLVLRKKKPQDYAPMAGIQLLISFKYKLLLCFYNWNVYNVV